MYIYLRHTYIFAQITKFQLDLMASSRNTGSFKDIQERSLPVLQSSQGHMRKSTSNFRLVDPYRETGNSGTWISFRDTGYMSLNPDKKLAQLFEQKKVKTESKKVNPELFLRTRSDFSLNKTVKSDNLYYDTIFKRLIETANKYAQTLENAKNVIRINCNEIKIRSGVFSHKAIFGFLDEFQVALKNSQPLNTGSAVNCFEILVNQAYCLADAVNNLHSINVSMKMSHERDQKARTDTQNTADYIEVTNYHADQ